MAGNSKRFFTVTDTFGATVGSGFIIDGPTRANNTAVNVGAAIAHALNLNPTTSVRVGKTEGAAEFRAAAKDKVKDGEGQFKAVAVV